MKFKDYLMLNEAKVESGVNVVVSGDYVKFKSFHDNYSKKIIESIFGPNTIDYQSLNNAKKGIEKTEAQIYPEDRSTITTANVKKLQEQLLAKETGANRTVKCKILRIDENLQNIRAGSFEEGVYKRLFGKNPVDSKTYKVGKFQFNVDNIVSNDVYLVTLDYNQTKTKKYSSYFKEYLFVRDEGMFDKDNAPSQYKKHF